MKIEEMITRLKDTPPLKNKARSLEIALHFSSEREEKDNIEKAITALYHKHFDLTCEDPHFSSFDEKDCQGDLLLGEMVKPGGSRQDMFLQLSELRQHMLVCGRAGSGKTNYIYTLLKELYRKKVPFLITDWKNDYADLDWSRLFEGIGDSESPGVHVLSVGRRNTPGLQFNPLIPPRGVEPSVWAKKICEVFTHAYMGGPRFEQIIRDKIDEFYVELGVYDNTQHSYPTIQDVKNSLEKRKCTGREAQWMQSVMSTLSSLCFGGTGQVFDCQTQPPLDYLLKENVVLDLSSLSNADKTFIVEALLLWIYHYRLEQPHAKKLQSVILLEEAHHLLNEKYESEETIMDIVLREIRSLGIGVVVIDQMPSLISKVALANNFIRLALNLVLSDDKEKMSRCMNLSIEQKDALGKIPVGSAIVKMQDRVIRPFLMRIPFVPVERIDRSSIPVSPYARQTDFSFRDGIPVVEKRKERISLIPPVDNSDEKRNPELKPELTLLKDIVMHPVSTVVERYKRLGMSPRKGNMAKRYLDREEWIDEQIIHGKNNWIKLLKITQAGEDELARLGVKNTSCLRHGGLEHKYWVTTIAEHFCTVFPDDQVLEEYPLGGGRTADVVVLKNDCVVLAVEVETGKSNVAANVQKYDSLSIPRVIIAFTNKQLLNRIPPCKGAQLTTTSQVVAMKKEQILFNNES